MKYFFRLRHLGFTQNGRPIFRVFGYALSTENRFEVMKRKDISSFVRGKWNAEHKCVEIAKEEDDILDAIRHGLGNDDFGFAIELRY